MVIMIMKEQLFWKICFKYFYIKTLSTSMLYPAFISSNSFTEHKILTHWGRVTHICVGYLTIIGSYNGLSPGRRQAITWTNVGILLIGPLGTNFSEMLVEIHIFSFKKIHLKMPSGKWQPFCLGLNVLITELPCYNSMAWVLKASQVCHWYREYISYFKCLLLSNII